MGGISLNAEGVKGLGCSEESEFELVLNACRGRLKTRAFRKRSYDDIEELKKKEKDSPVETSRHHRFPIELISLFERRRIGVSTHRLSSKSAFAHVQPPWQEPVARPPPGLQETVWLSATVVMPYWPNGL